MHMMCLYLHGIEIKDGQIDHNKFIKPKKQPKEIQFVGLSSKCMSISIE